VFPKDVRLRTVVHERILSLTNSAGAETDRPNRTWVQVGSPGRLGHRDVSGAETGLRSGVRVTEPELSPQLFMPAAGRDAAKRLSKKKARRLIVASPMVAA
jgi:hypothetical protein